MPVDSLTRRTTSRSLVSIPDPARSGSGMEASDLEVVQRVRESTDIPLAVKISPYYSALANFALSVVETGADGLVLFNRFYQPDLDADSREVVPRLELSQPWELRLPLRRIAIQRSGRRSSHGWLNSSLGTTSRESAERSGREKRLKR